jgi:hypothetical protein
MAQGFKVLEQLCEGKGAPNANEDRLVITPHFVAVIDGATSSTPLASGKAGGVVAAEAIAAAVEAFPADITARAAVDAMTQAVFNATGPWPDESQNRPCAAVVIYSATREEIWRVNDCHFRLDATPYVGGKMVDHVSYTYRSTLLRAQLRRGLINPELEQQENTGRIAIRDYISLQNAFENILDDPLGYGVINGLPVPDKFIEIHVTTGARELVLCSDGFFHPPATLAEGLAELARLKREDPLLCLQVNGSRPFPPDGRFFDDTTYVRLELN